MEVRIFDKTKVVFDQEIGKGSFGRVYKATISGSKLPIVAIKIFLEEIHADQTEEKAYAELSKVASLEHENVVKLIGMVEDRIPWLVFEYMKGGNLLQYVIRKKNPNEKKLIRYCRDICRGMAYLHRNQYLHRDLAARNILLEDKVAKIADLGLCTILTEANHGCDYSVAGKIVAVRHAAAECIVEAVYTQESDVWSFGVLMWEIWTGGQVPYGKELKEPEIRRVIAEGMKPTDLLAPKCTPSISSVMSSVLQVDRSDRPTFHTLRLAFEDIRDGQKIQLSRYPSSPSRFQTNSPSQSPSFAFSPVPSAFLGTHNPRQVAQSPTISRFGVPQPSNMSTTPDIKKMSSLSRQAQINFAQMNGTTRAASTSSRDLRLIPGEINMNRRYSDEGLPDPPMLQPGKLYPMQASKLLSVSAQNLNNRLAKSQSDIHQEMMKELVPNRFQKTKK